MIRIDLEAVVSILFGLWLGLFSQPLAARTSDFFYRSLGRRYSVTGYRIAFLIGGMFFTITGVLSLFGLVGG